MSFDKDGDTIKYLKNIKSAANSSRGLNTTSYGKLKSTFSKLQNTYGWKKFNFKGISKLDIAGFGVSFIIDETADFHGWINSYSSLIATQAAFEESKDILMKIVANDNAKEKFVASAAQEILYTINNEHDKFVDEQLREFNHHTNENVASLALNILSGANPYVLAVNLAIGALDFLTPTTEIAESSYYLYVIDELVNASKSLFIPSAKVSGYYDIEDNQKRYIELLICARIYGGEFAKNITGSQHYWGLFNDDRIRREYADTINAESSNLQYYLDILVNG